MWSEHPQVRPPGRFPDYFLNLHNPQAKMEAFADAHWRTAVAPAMLVYNRARSNTGPWTHALVTPPELRGTTHARHAPTPQ